MTAKDRSLLECPGKEEEEEKTKDKKRRPGARPRFVVAASASPSDFLVLLPFSPLDCLPRSRARAFGVVFGKCDADTTTATKRQGRCWMFVRGREGAIAARAARDAPVHPRSCCVEGPSPRACCEREGFWQVGSIGRGSGTGPLLGISLNQFPTVNRKVQIAVFGTVEGKDLSAT
jgi:hypothetical protein